MRSISMCIWAVLMLGLWGCDDAGGTVVDVKSDGDTAADVGRDGSLDGPCTEGNTQSCGCTNGQTGVQVCSNYKYGVCSCDDVDTFDCIPGTNEECTCPPFQGLRSCAASGTWDECICEGIDLGEWPPDAVVGMEYRFVYIDDSSDAIDPEDGADIDAIILEKADGTVVYADQINEVEFVGFIGTHTNVNDAIGAPDAVDYESAAPSCPSDTGYVALSGGFLIAELSSPIEEGDTVSVIEVGGCDTGGGVMAVAESVRVMVGVVGESTDANWVVLGEGAGPKVELSVGVLPVIPIP